MPQHDEYKEGEDARSSGVFPARHLLEQRTGKYFTMIENAYADVGSYSDLDNQLMAWWQNHRPRDVSGPRMPSSCTGCTGFLESGHCRSAVWHLLSNHEVPTWSLP